MADRVARVATIALVVALGAVGIALPESILVGGIAWLAFLVAALSGWGFVVARLARVDDPDLGLRATWGMAGFLAVAGIALMAGVCGRPFILAAIGAGGLAFGWRELTTARPMWQSARDGIRTLRTQPLVACIGALAAIAILVHVVGAVAHLDRSPWDDDIAYTPLLKRLLDAGDLVEPFSFRRLAAYGGQTVLQALVGARGNLASIHALDQALCYGLVFLLLVGHARSVGASSFWLVLVVLVLVLMPDISINTASYWSGAVFFLALYRTVASGHLVLAALVGAATCTLRQNYLPVVVLFLALAVLSQLQREARASSWRAAWRARRPQIMRAVALAAIVLVQWAIAALISSRTFLYPFMQGTWNHGLSLGPSGWSWVDELSLVMTTVIDSRPLAVMVVIVPLMLFASDQRPMRPVTSLLLASVAGFLLLVHAFPDADSPTMWRYAFGYVVPLFAVFALEAGTEREAKADAGADAAPLQLPPLGRWVLIAALLVQIADFRGGQVKHHAAMLSDIREALARGLDGDPTDAVEQREYGKLQAAVPAGARLVVMLDDPGYLDFARNDIANLDVPGFASPGTQMPSFEGAEAMRAYFLAHGYRYLAFVRSDFSRYAFRRTFWVWRLFNDTEFFQAMSAYSIDMIDTLAKLAETSRVLYESGTGLVALDLEPPGAPTLDLPSAPSLAPPVLDPATERGRRERYTRELARSEGLGREWSLSTRANLVFAGGTSGLTFAQPADNATWNEVAERDPEPTPETARASQPTRGTPIRWVYRRLYLRVRGDADMHLVIRGRVQLNHLYTRPRLDASLDGTPLASIVVDETGAFTIDVVVAKESVADWSDLYVVFNAIGQPEKDTRDPHLVRLEEVTWEPQ